MTDYFTFRMPQSEVLAIHPHFSTPSQTLEFSSTLTRGAGLTSIVDNDQKTDGITIDFVYRLMNHVEQNEYHQFLAQRSISGKSFYMPTWVNNFNVVANISSGASQVTIKENGFGTWYDSVAGVRVDDRTNPWGYTFYGVMFLTSDGHRYFFRLGKASNTSFLETGPAEPNIYIDNGNGTATLYLRVESTDQSFIKTYTPEEIRLCSLVYRGVAAPTINYYLHSTAVVETRLTVSEVFFEGPHPDSSPTSGYGILMESDDGQDQALWMLNGSDLLVLDTSSGTATVSLSAAPPSGTLNYNDVATVSLTSI